MRSVPRLTDIYFFVDPDRARTLVATAWWQVAMPLMVRSTLVRFRTRRYRLIWRRLDWDYWMCRAGENAQIVIAAALMIILQAFFCTRYDLAWMRSVLSA
jgi:hypothetical protein